jgi:hypothetical protein
MRSFSITLFIITMAIGLTGCEHSSDDTTVTGVDVTQHDNIVILMPDWGATGVSFTLTDHDITSGQPWGGVSSSYQGGSLSIDAKAGRHNSGGCATWFKDHCSNATCCNWPSGCNPWPSELNFAFTGTLIIDGDSYTITLGQGSDGVHNNWWVGGPSWTTWSSPFGDAVVTPDSKYYFEAADDTFNQIYIRKKP